MDLSLMAGQIRPFIMMEERTVTEVSGTCTKYTSMLGMKAATVVLQHEIDRPDFQDFLRRMKTGHARVIASNIWDLVQPVVKRHLEQRLSKVGNSSDPGIKYLMDSL